MTVILKETIDDLLPYGKDFCFISEVLDLIPNESIRTSARFDLDHPIIKAHFTEGPHIVPGVILLEQVCQSALLLGLKSTVLKKSETSLLGQARSIFKRPAVAPCDVVVNVTFDRTVGNVVAFSGTAFVKDEEIASFRCVSADTSA